MKSDHPNGKYKKVPIPKHVVGTRYEDEKIDLLHVVRIRRKKRHISDVVTIALDDLLVREGLLPEAA